MPTKKSVLVLRTCAKDMTSHGDFKWPKRGKVKCPDWQSTPECGHGLHGLLWGEGNGFLLSWDEEAKWLVVKVDEDKIVDIDGDKVKFPEGSVVYCGDRKGATDYILEHGAAGRAVVGAMVFVGDRGTATAGDKGTATAGDWGTATAGEWGTATAGDKGTATAGDWGTATAGEWGTATAGEKGILNIKWWDSKNSRYRVITGYVGEDGIEPNVPYVVEEGKLVKKEK